MKFSDTWTISGQVVTGQGQGRGFTQLPWARRQFLDRLGIDPHPGTFNVVARKGPDLRAWRALQASPGIPIVPAGEACPARCFPVRVAGRFSAAIVLPQVEGYPASQLEILAGISLRQALHVEDGDWVSLTGVYPMPVQAVIFDVDGTLVDSIGGYHLAAEKAAAAYGFAVAESAVRSALNHNLSFWEQVIPETLRGDTQLLSALRRDTMEHWPAILAQSVTLFPGVALTLNALRAAGLRLAIYTGSRGESFRPLRLAGLLDRFETVLTAEHVHERKPHPEGLLRCAEALKLAPASIAYIGDAAVDMQAAQAAGMMAIGLLSGAGDCSQLTLAGAHRLCVDHAGLIPLLT